MSKDEEATLAFFEKAFSVVIVLILVLTGFMGAHQFSILMVKGF